MPDYRIAITDRNSVGVAVESHEDMHAACDSVSRSALRIRADSQGSVMGEGMLCEVEEIAGSRREAFYVYVAVLGGLSETVGRGPRQ